MRTLVLGAGGQLGRDLLPRLPGEAVAADRARADLTRPESLASCLDEVRPGVVVNCAAYNFVDRAEAEPEAAFAVNAWGVRALAVECGRRGLTLVHFSTDYVFGLDAGRRTPYREDDAPGPVSVYGLSKLVGEYLVQSICPRHLIIRTCGLYGAWGSGGKGGNFVETMLRLASAGKPLRVVHDQVCTPSYTADVAEAALALVRTGRYGLYHLRNEGSCSWYEFAGGIFELVGMKAELTPISSGEFGAAARRPGYSVLGMGALEALGLPPPRPWREALAAYLIERGRRQHAVTP